MNHALQVAITYVGMWPEEVLELHRLALLLPPDPLIINVGSGPGTSSLAVAEMRPDARIYSIDLSLSGLEITHFREVHLDHLLTQMDCGSQAAAAGWTHGLADLIFIDAGHSYENCRDDILAWTPHLAADGILCVHDHHPFETQYAGVVRAVRELLDEQPEWQLLTTVATLRTYRRADAALPRARRKAGAK